MRSYFNTDAEQQSPGKTGGRPESSLLLFEVSAARPAAESVIRLHVHSFSAGQSASTAGSNDRSSSGNSRAGRISSEAPQMMGISGLSEVTLPST